MPLKSDLTAAETLVTLTRSTSSTSTSTSSNKQSRSYAAGDSSSSVMSNFTSSSTHKLKEVPQSLESIESDALNSFFPLQLYDIVSDEANVDIIRWLPSGKAFVIADKKRFADEVLPLCFIQNSQFTSFTRKLTRWHFNRVPRGPLIGAYYHELFVKDKRDLCYHMICKIMTRKETRRSEKSFAPARVPSALINMSQGMQPVQTQVSSFSSLIGIESKYPFAFFGSTSSAISSSESTNLETLARIELDIRRIQLAGQTSFLENEKARMSALREGQRQNELREVILVRAQLMNVVRNAGKHFSKNY